MCKNSDRPLGEAQPLGGLAVELDGLIIRAVGTEVADDSEDQVLGGHAGPEAALENDFDGLRDTQPDVSRRPDRRHFAPSDAGGKRTGRAGGTGMAVRSEDDAAGKRVALLHHDLVAHAAAGVEIVVVRDPLLMGEVPDGFL